MVLAPEMTIPQDIRIKTTVNCAEGRRNKEQLTLEHSNSHVARFSKARDTGPESFKIFCKNFQMGIAQNKL